MADAFLSKQPANQYPLKAGRAELQGGVLVVQREGTARPRRVTPEYIDSALKACADYEAKNGVLAPRLAEWQSLKACFDRVQASKSKVKVDPDAFDKNSLVAAAKAMDLPYSGSKAKIAAALSDVVLNAKAKKALGL